MVTAIQFMGQYGGKYLCDGTVVQEYSTGIQLFCMGCLWQFFCSLPGVLLVYTFIEVNLANWLYLASLEKILACHPIMCIASNSHILLLNLSQRRSKISIFVQQRRQYNKYILIHIKISMKRYHHRSCPHIPIYMAVSDRPENPDGMVQVPVQFTRINCIVQLWCTALYII